MKKCTALFVVLVIGACAGGPPLPQPRAPERSQIHLTCNLSWLERAINYNACAPIARH
jgi:hypothetical protein